MPLRIGYEMTPESHTLSVPKGTVKKIYANIEISRLSSSRLPFSKESLPGASPPRCGNRVSHFFAHRAIGSWTGICGLTMRNSVADPGNKRGHRAVG
jgi:hypothetical protein